MNVLQSHKGVGKSSVDPIDNFIDMLAKYDGLLSKHVDTTRIV